MLFGTSSFCANAAGATKISPAKTKKAKNFIATSVERIFEFGSVADLCLSRRVFNELAISQVDRALPLEVSLPFNRPGSLWSGAS
jgi:hypothetical protein